MPSFTQLFVVAAAVAALGASATPTTTVLERAAQHGHHCPGSKLHKHASLNVHGKNVTIQTFQCTGATHHSRRDLFDSPPLCYLFGTCKKPEPKPPAPTPAPPPPKNVCGVTCTPACNDNAGSLPPITEDCDMIENAIQIFQGQTTTFVVDPNHLTTLSYGTCSYFFSNADQYNQLEYCWADLSVTASKSGSACFPPVMPIHSEGLCTAGDGSWAAGSAHS